MTFLHPWAIVIGAIAAGLPVAVHLLTRPRPVRMPLSTLRFLHEAVRQRAARHRLRDFLILSLRTAAILLIALAVAQPQWGKQSPIAAGQDGDDTVRVVVLDVSQSMAATHGGIEAIERARTAAAGYLRYRPGLQANLILAGATPRGIFDGPSTNFDVLREELAGCRALPERLDINRALDAAAKMLAPRAEDDARKRELVVVSDFQRANFGGVDFARLPKDTQIQLESVSPAEPPANLAILEANAYSQSAAGKTVLLNVVVGNFSSTDRKASVEVDIGRATYRLNKVCAAGEETTFSQEIKIREEGWQWGEARLVGNDDALVADDSRPLVVQVKPRPLYALISRQSASERPSSSHFLECALLPDKRLKDKASAEVLRLDPALADRRTLAPVDMILLDHPGKLSEDLVSLLAALMRRGRPIVYVTGESIDATNLKLIGQAAGAELQMPVEFTPPPAGAGRRNMFIASARAERAPFSVFGDDVLTVTGRLRFAGGLGSRRLEGGLQKDVLATYGDGTACMVHCASGKGALAVINADLGESTLPKSSAFVPLLDGLIAEMLQNNGSANETHCGETLVASLPEDIASAANLKVIGPEVGDSQGTDAGKPDSKLSLGELFDQGAGVAWRWQNPDRPGVYRIAGGGQTVFCLPIVTAAEESRLESLASKELTGRLAGERDVYFSGADEDQQGNDSWKWLAAACIVCMLGEIVALVTFRT